MWRVCAVLAIAATEVACSSSPLSDEDDLMRRPERFREATFVIGYDVYLGPDPQTAVAGMVWYQQGARTRVDTLDSPFGSSASIRREDSSYNCVNNPDQEPAYCITYGPAGEPVSHGGYQMQVPWNALLSPADYVLAGSNERTIAEEAVNCFLLQAKEVHAASREDVEVCLSEDGLMLGAHMPGGGPSTLTATNVSETVPSDAFDPPYPLRE